MNKAKPLGERSQCTSFLCTFKWIHYNLRIIFFNADSDYQNWILFILCTFWIIIHKSKMANWKESWNVTISSRIKGNFPLSFKIRFYAVNNFNTGNNNSRLSHFQADSLFKLSTFFLGISFWSVRFWNIICQVSHLSCDGQLSNSMRHTYIVYINKWFSGLYCWLSPIYWSFFFNLNFSDVIWKL